VLGHAALRFEKLLDLTVGDLICLDADEQGSLPIYVQGRQKLSGSPCVNGGSMALRVEHDIATFTRGDSNERTVH
jgi:flagellar motor switch protein FliM